MKLSCALVLTLTNLVIATPFSFSVKGSGSTPTGTFGIVQPVASKTSYSGGFSKAPSSSFASSSASESTGSFNYNSGQVGTPSLAFNTGGLVPPTQAVGQNVAVAPQAFASAIAEQKPVSQYLVPSSKPSVSQDTSKKTEFFVSNVKDGSFGQTSNSGSVQYKPNTQAQVTSIVEKKQVYSSGFGGPPGILNPYDKVSSTGGNQVNNAYQPFTQFSESLNSAPQGYVYTPVSNIKPSYSYQEKQQLGTNKPIQSFSSEVDYTTFNAGSYKPESKPSNAGEDKIFVNVNGNPSSELKPTNDVQLAVDKYVNQVTEIAPSKKPGFSAEYVTQGIKPGSQFSAQSYPGKEPFQTVNQYGYIATEAPEKFKQTQEPSYPADFGAPAGALKPSTPNEVHKFVTTTVKPEKYDFSKSNVEFTATNTEVNKYNSNFSGAKPTEKPTYESTNYQSFEIGSSPASYVTLNPTSSDSYSKQDGGSSGFGISSTAETLSAIQQKDDVQTLTKPSQSFSVNPTLTPWEQNPTIASSSIVQTPEYGKPVKPVVQVSSQSESVYSNAYGTFVTNKPSSSYAYQVETSPTSPLPWEYSGLSYSNDKTKPNNQLVSSNQYKPSFTGGVSGQIEGQKPSYQSYPTGNTLVSSDVASGYKPVVTSAPFDKTNANSEVQLTSQKEIGSQTNDQEINSSLLTAQPTVAQNLGIQSGASYDYSTGSQQSTYRPSFERPANKFPAFAFSGNPSVSPSKNPSFTQEQKESQKTSIGTSNKETLSTVSVGTFNQFSDNVEPQFSKKPTVAVTNQNKPSYSTTYGTLTGSTGYKPGSTNFGYESTFESSEKVKQPLQVSSTDLQKPTFSSNFGQQTEVLKPFNQKTSGSYVVSSNFVSTEKPLISSEPSKTSSQTSNSDKKESEYYVNQNKQPFPNTPNQLNGNGFSSGSSFNSQQNTYGGLTSVSATSASQSQQPLYKPLSDSSSTTSSVTENSDKQTLTDKSTSTQKIPSVAITSAAQKPTKEPFATNSAFSSGTTTFGSTPQYQLPATQPATQIKPLYSNNFGTFGVAKPYKNVYPGFTSSFTTFGPGSSVTPGPFDKTKQTSQFTSTGQYTPTSYGQYKPFATGQYKPYNWGFGGQSSFQKFSNVPSPTGGTFISTYAPTTFKPFVTPSPLNKSKTSTSFSVTGNKESTYTSGYGSTLTGNVTKTSSLIQTTNKPVSGTPSSVGYTDKPSTPKYETPKNQPGETQSNKPNQWTQNSGSVLISTSDQSSFSSVKPNFDLPTSLGQSEVNSGGVNPTTQSAVANVDYNTKESGYTPDVTKVSETTYTLAPVTQISPTTQNKPYSDKYVGSAGAQPSSSSTSQTKPDEKEKYSQTSKFGWAYGSSSTSGSFDKTKQTSQFISTGQYTPTSSGQYKPFSTGQYKPYNWQFGGQTNVQKFSNVFSPAGGIISSTYAPTSFKPFATSSAGYTEKVSSLTFATTPKYEISQTQPDKTQSNKPSQWTQNWGSSSISSLDQSSFNSVTPTIDSPTTSGQFEVNSVNVNPTSVSGNVGYTAQESGYTSEVNKVSEPSYTLGPVTEVSPTTASTPYSDIYVETLGTKASSLSPSQTGGKTQFSQTLNPNWSSSSNQKEPSLTSQQFFSTTSNSYNKELYPTQLNDKKASIYGSFSEQTSAGVTTGSTSGGFSDFELSQKQSSQSVVSGSNQGNTGFSFNSEVQSSPIEKWSSDNTFGVSNKPEYSSSLNQPGHGYNSAPSVSSTSGVVSGSVENSKPNKPIVASSNIQYNSPASNEPNVKPEQFVSTKPTSQVSTLEKQSAYAESYKEKDTNQASFTGSYSKPTTVSGTYNTDAKVQVSKYSDSVAEQTPYKPNSSSDSNTQELNQINPTVQANLGGYDSSKQSNQQSWGFNEKNGASQSNQAPYIGGFGGPSGILKPNDFNSPSQQYYVQVQYKPNENNQGALLTQKNPPASVSSTDAVYLGGFGGPSGVLKPNEYVKQNTFGLPQSENKYSSTVQAGGIHAQQSAANTLYSETPKNVYEQAGFQTQASANAQANAAAAASAGGFINDSQYVQNPFNSGVSSGVGFPKNNYKFSGQLGGSKAFGTVQRSSGLGAGFSNFGKSFASGGITV